MAAPSYTARASEDMDYAGFLEAHLGVVDRVVRAIALAGGLPPADTADFRAEALLHLIADDYRVLRAFEGRCSLHTYLAVVLKRLWQDKCARKWGRWRPSAEARRLGDVAIRLERLVQRDGWTLDDAIAALQAHEGLSVEALRAMWLRLPPRVPRRMTTEDALEDRPVPMPDTSARLEQRESTARVSRTLRAVLAGLPHDDRRLLRLRFVEGWSMADIARHLAIRQSQIYPRFLQVLQRVRSLLEARGLSAEEIRQAFGVDVPRAA